MPWTLETGQWTANKKDQRAAFFHQMNDNLIKTYEQFDDDDGLTHSARFKQQLASQAVCIPTTAEQTAIRVSVANAPFQKHACVPPHQHAHVPLHVHVSGLFQCPSS